MMKQLHIAEDITKKRTSEELDDYDNEKEAEGVIKRLIQQCRSTITNKALSHDLLNSTELILIEKLLMLD